MGRLRKNQFEDAQTLVTNLTDRGFILVLASGNGFHLAPFEARVLYNYSLSSDVFRAQREGQVSLNPIL